jgi:hypothetical protein
VYVAFHREGVSDLERASIDTFDVENRDVFPLLPQAMDVLTETACLLEVVSIDLLIVLECRQVERSAYSVSMRLVEKSPPSSDIDAFILAIQSRGSPSRPRS